jgi:hypothetical protein
LSASWWIISLASVLYRTTYSLYLALAVKISDYERHVTIAKTANIPGKVTDATYCPHSKNELTLLSESKNWKYLLTPYL